MKVQQFKTLLKEIVKESVREVLEEQSYHNGTPYMGDPKVDEELTHERSQQDSFLGGHPRKVSKTEDKKPSTGINAIMEQTRAELTPETASQYRGGGEVKEGFDMNMTSDNIPRGNTPPSHMSSKPTSELSMEHNALPDFAARAGKVFKKMNEKKGN